MARWSVEYDLEAPLEVDGRPSGYPGLGVTFHYTDTGGITTIHHEFELDDAAMVDDARRTSHAELRLLFDAVAYWRGAPLVSSNVRPVQLSAPGIGVTLHALGTVSDGPPRRIALPKESALLPFNARLAAWLPIVVRARSEGSDENAIRDYALIIEEAIDPLPDASEAQHVTYVRHFASHPALDRPRPVAFINRELGRPPGPTCPPYDPRDLTQRALFQRWRPVARRIAEAEVDRVLPPTR